MTKSNYELECEQYALCPTPYQDAMDNEFNARYDDVRERFGGYESLDAAPPYVPTMRELLQWEAYDEKVRRNEWDDGTEPQLFEGSDRYVWGEPEEIPF